MASLIGQRVPPVVGRAQVLVRQLAAREARRFGLEHAAHFAAIPIQCTVAESSHETRRVNQSRVTRSISSSVLSPAATQRRPSSRKERIPAVARACSRIA